MDIQERLFELQDEKYRDFTMKLIPGASAESIIGVRTPALKKLAAEIIKSGAHEKFLAELPHRYFEENQLHAFVISGQKYYDRAVGLTDAFLPYVDNWATCDQLRPKIFAKNKDKLISSVREWLGSDKAYTVRFAVGMLMCHYLDEAFTPEYPGLVAAIESDEYYINMMRAWYFATALAKQYDNVIAYIEERRLDKWTHNKTIQKARESFRVPDERKEYLRTLKI